MYICGEKKNFNPNCNMKIHNLIRQHVWLLDTIFEKGPISLEDINKRWVKTEMSGGVEMSRHTFIRYKTALVDTFGIDIECDRRTNQYYINNPKILRDNSIQRWMLSALTVSNIVGESISLQDRILLENIPTEEKTLSLFIDAMKQQHQVSFLYKKHKDTEPKERFITPCCIKLFRQRWYVIDYNPQDTEITFKPFAFDRISNPRITDKSFALPADFSADDIFMDSYGIFIDEKEKPQRIVIRAFGDMRKYIRDLPLHHSQEIKNEDDDYTDYTYYIRPSVDFIAELLSMGDKIEVLSPDSLRERIRAEHLKAARKYQKM